MWSELLFDLDGTLTDPAECITGSVRYAMEKMGHPVLPQEVLLKFIGPPLDEMFADVCGFTHSETQQAILYFREYFSETGIHQNRLYSGMAETLARLKAAGKRMYIATTKPSLYATQILETFEIAHYFNFVSGSELTHAGSPKAEIVQRVLDETGIDPKKAVMIGDRLHDVVGAHKNGLPCIGLLLGYGGRQELEDAGADYIAEDLAQLEQLLLA